MSSLFAKLRVVLAALPTWLAAASAVLTVLGTEVVPLLPGGWAVQAAGWVAVALAWLSAAAAVVARVTTVLPDQRGVLNDPGTRVETHTVFAPDAPAVHSGP